MKLINKDNYETLIFKDAYDNNLKLKMSKSFDF